jgi:ankyrin repeat protein
MLHRFNFTDLDRFFKDDPAHYLHRAVLHDDLPAIRDLLNAGYDIDKMDDAHGSPLHVAIWCDRAPSFELLFVSGADLDILDRGDEGRQEDTPIRLAARLGRRAMFKRLWNAGVARDTYAPYVSVPARRSLIEVSSFEGHADIVQDALDWSEEWMQDQICLALSLACREWHLGVVKVLLRACDFTAQDLESGMHFVVTSLPSLGKGWISTKERLLTLEEDSARQVRVLKLLLNAHAQLKCIASNVDKISALVSRLLIVASSSSFMNGAMKLLLEHGADPNTQDSAGGGTPLHRAVVRRRDVQKCNEEGVELLLSYGARVDLFDAQGNSAINCARECGKPAVAWRLLEYSNNLGSKSLPIPQPLSQE